MIPKIYIEKLDSMNNLSYDQINDEYNKFLKDIEQTSENNSTFYKEWTNTNILQTSLINKNEASEYIIQTTQYPQAATYKKHIEIKINNLIKDLDDVHNYINYISYDNIGLIDYTKLEALRNKYQQQLFTVYLPDEKRIYQKYIDDINDIIIECRTLNESTNNYWNEFNNLRNTWQADVKEYKQKIENIVNAKKNGEPKDTLDSSSDSASIQEIPFVLTSAQNTSNNTNNYMFVTIPETDTSGNVFSNSNENIYQNIITNTPSNNTPEKTVHTRIYKLFDASIQLDEMSIPVFDNIDTPFKTTGEDTSASYATLSETGYKNDSDVDSDPFQTAGNTSPKKSMGIGFLYPLIRINDHYYIDNDIKYFSLESVGFIPTIELILECKFNDILKVNAIKDGDICSVFINPGHGTVKSYRGDFQITHVKIPKIDQFKIAGSIKVKILGELYIPSLYNTNLGVEIPGRAKRILETIWKGSQGENAGKSSRDALIEMSAKLGLGFFFSDPENTNDLQFWNKYDSDDQLTGGDAPNLKYLKYVSKHAYKNFESFYDCWIDPRYGLSFINIAQMLGGSGLDEEIDLAVFNSTLVAGKLADAENRETTDSEKFENPKPQLKILTNFGTEESTETAFLVTSYGENNDSTITNEFGFTTKNYYSIQNPGISNVSEGSITDSYCIPVNNDKLKNGFYIMAGPGQNLTYTQANNGSFVKQHNSVKGGSLIPVISDVDTNTMKEGDNSTTSGNVNKYFKVAEEHNKLCNKWLLKKTISVTLNGCNLQLMRGEKIPMLLKDNFTPEINFMQANSDEDYIYQQILPQGSGWFIIHDIKWIYNNNIHKHGTPWRTELTLTRREWPIPGYNKSKKPKEKNNNENDSSITVETDIATGTVKEANGENNQLTNNSSTANMPDNKDITTNGLQPYMVTIYEDIKNACNLAGVKFNLISGRRWPVDENGNKVDKPTIKDGNMWKFVNSNGDIVWYTSETSPHITGDAIDIINSEGSNSVDILQCILKDDKTLYDMLINKTYFGNETMDNNANAIVHFHIGKIDKSNQSTLDAFKIWWNVVVAQQHGNIKYGNNIIKTTDFGNYF